MRVLLIEDEPVQQRIYARLLRSLEHEPLIASDIEEAETMLESSAFDAILLDVLLGGSVDSAHDFVAKRVSSGDDRLLSSLVVITGLDPIRVRESLPPRDYAILVKPVAAIELATVLDGIAELNALRQSESPP